MPTGISEAGEFLAPWRNVSRVQPDGSVTYYAASPTQGCLPCLPSAADPLSRHELRLSDFANRYRDVADNSTLAGKRVLLVVNPKSGTGAASASRADVSDVSQILSEAGLHPVVRHTERPAHAIEIMRGYGREQLPDFAAVLAVGGDGTLHEVLNGLVQAFSIAPMSADDWARVPPLAVVPSGSGNAIAVSTGVTSAKLAGLNVVHSLRARTAKPLAVMQYRRLSESSRERVVIGGVQWGLPADADQGTDHLRFMGDVRFDLAAVAYIARKSCPHARIKITVNLEAHEKVKSAIRSDRARMKGERKEQVEPLAEKEGEDTYVFEEEFVMIVAWNSSCIGDGFMVTPEAKVTETGMFDLILVRAEVSRAELLRLLTSCSDGSFMHKSDQFEYFKAQRVEFEAIEGKFLTVDGEPVPVEPFVLEMAPEDGLIRILDSFSEP